MLTMHPDKTSLDSKLPNTEMNRDEDEGGSSHEKLTCPVCMAVISDGIEVLERHVDGHFTNNESRPEMDATYLMANRQLSRGSQSNSASSLIANVDENFEIDQVITLSDFNSLEDNNRDGADLDVDTYNGKFVLFLVSLIN